MRPSPDVDDASHPAPSALRNVYSSVRETSSAVSLTTVGAFPPWLDGCLWRNGPGQFEVGHADGGETNIRHWFDGISMLHRFSVSKGKVTYSSKLTAPGIVRAAAAVTKNDFVLGIGIGLQDPCKSLYGRAMTLWRGVSPDPEGDSVSNVGVTVERIPGLGLMSRTDSATMYRIDEESLEAQEFSSWAAVEVAAGSEKGRGTSGVMSAAHGEFDASTNEYFNFTSTLGPSAQSTFTVFAVSESGGARTVADFSHQSTYMHSLAMTERYVIMILHPARVNSLKLLYYSSIASSLMFDNDAGTVFYVMRRNGGGMVARYTAPSFFQFHTVNAWDDENGDVHIDLCRYGDASILEQLYTENLRSKSGSFFDSATLHRFTLSGVRGIAENQEASGSDSPASETVNATPLLAARQRELCPEGLELPRINPAYARRPYRYVYGPGVGSSSDGEDGALFARILKIDLESDAVVDWSQPHVHCSEAIFVADPDGEEEDDGVLLAVCHDAVQTRSFLLVLDARTLAELARAYTPVTVPAGFHGAFVS